MRRGENQKVEKINEEEKRNINAVESSEKKVIRNKMATSYRKKNKQK